MSSNQGTFSSRGAFVDGSWRSPDGEPFLSRNPANTDQVIGEFRDCRALVNDAVSSAAAAQIAWRRAPLSERLAVLEGFAAELEQRQGRFAEAIAQEVGKPIQEARAEAGALAKKARITAQLARRELQKIEIDGVGYYTQRPLGVFAVIGPFNFPMHLSNGHVLPALVSGNAVILKPSETAPACGELYVRAWEATCSKHDVDPRLLQLVQGDGACGAALVEHSEINGVGFTGSYEVGVALRRATAASPHKLLALEMGGKNTSIVLDDANIAKSIEECIFAAFASTGQRCTATSRVLVHESIAEAWIQAFVRRAESLRMGDPLREDTDYGPLSTLRARDRFDQAQTELDGLRPRMQGGAVEGPTPGYWVKPSIHEVVDVDRARPRIETELFGPEVLIERFSEDGEAVTRANATPYGLAMAVYTSSTERFSAMRDELESGLVNLNRSTAGASSELPFGGTKHSGNHRPAGAWSLKYTFHPVATMVG